MVYTKLFLLKSFHSSSLKCFRSAVVFNSFYSVSTKHLLRSYAPIKTHTRSFWETFPYFRPLFHEKDGLNKDKYDLIYHSPIFQYAFYAQVSCFAIIGSEIFAGLHYIYKAVFPPETVDIVTHVGPFVLNTTSLSSIIVMTLFNVQAIVMIYAAQTAVLRAYFNDETESVIFVKLGFNPFKSRFLDCYAGELHALEESPFGFLFGNHKLKRERLFIRTDNFKSFHLYNTLLSKDYDK